MKEPADTSKQLSGHAGASQGAVLLGTLQMTEAATFDHHPAAPVPLNPWGKELWPGISSSGAGVALSAGLSFGSIGSDTGGSLRFPAACTGTTALKPSWGTISSHGTRALAASFDHLGPLARSAEDARVLLDAATAGPTPERCAAVDSQGLAAMKNAHGHAVRIAVDWEDAAGRTDQDTLRILGEALSVLGDLGAEIVPTRLPEPTLVIEASMLLIATEMAEHHRDTFPLRAESYSVTVRRTLERGNAASAQQIAAALATRRAYSGSLARVFDSADLLLCPVFRQASPSWAELRALVDTDPTEVYRYTVPFNAAGLPTITLPGGHGADGRPLGFQLAGPRASDQLLLEIGAAFQSVTDHHLRRPET